MDACPPIFLLTDFGPGGYYQGVMRGVLARIAPGAPIHDLHHGVRQGDVREAAYVLEAALPYLPEKAVVVCVVDPGVGSERRILVARSGDRRFLAPDNGLLTPLLEGDEPLEVHLVQEVHYTLESRSATFHGRDIFAPVAAHVALGLQPEDLGPPVEDPVRLAAPPAAGEAGCLAGTVVHVDPFGNLVTDLTAGDLRELAASGGLRVEAGGQVLEVHRTFSDVPPGRALAYLGSSGHLEVAVRDGSAGKVLGLAHGDPVRVRVEP